MPRGVKGSGKVKTGKSVESRIAEVDKVIADLKAKISEAKAKKKKLVKMKDDAELNAIQKVIQKSGVSPDQLKEMLTNNS